jgi:hypothetical protein
VASGLARVVAFSSAPGVRLNGEPLDGRRVVVEATADGLAIEGD